MLAYVIRRTLQTAPVLIGVTLVLFALVHLQPGFGFDQPPYLQYLSWLGHSITGDFGLSVFNASPVAGQVLQALYNTMTLVVPAALLGIGLGLLLGLFAGFHPDRWPGKIISAITFVCVGLPPYWCAIVLVLLGAVLHRWLPTAGMGGLLMPVLALAIVPMGVVGQQVRATVQEIRGRTFPVALAARGLPGWPMLRHICRNAAPSALALLGPQFGYLLGGSILVETVFNWPGSGHLMRLAILQHDVPVLQATLLALAVLFVLLSLLIDITRAAIDPRLRR